MVKITGRWFSYSAYGTAMGVISLSYLFGDAAARRFMGLLLEAGLGWREVFWAAAGVLFVLSVLNWLWLKESPRAIGQEEPAANPLNVYGQRPQDSGTTARSLRSLLVPLVTSPEFLVVCLLSLGLTLLRETFNLWTPTYFTEVVGSSRVAGRQRKARCFRCWAGRRCCWPAGSAIGWGRRAGPASSSAAAAGGRGHVGLGLAWILRAARLAPVRAGGAGRAF